jgi:glycosyltransferase involved in cell wall biosynthesis
LRILHVSHIDLGGRRFNGYDLMTELRGRGFISKQVVLRKDSANQDVTALLRGPGDEDFQASLEHLEYRHSMRNLLYPWGRVIAAMPEFRSADVVHYHQIHNGMISLLDLPGLLASKPSVWTFHDPWPLTGHCVQPLECTGWLTGCAPCPRLDLLFPMMEDGAGRMWEVKRQIYSQIDVDVVVASDFMRDMVGRSPLTAHIPRLHLIPFGVDPDVFLSDDARDASRRSLGIPRDDFVILFRSTPSQFKGLEFILQALGSEAPARPTTLLTMERIGLVKELRRQYRVVELGWVRDPALYARALSACDVLLMPSTAEAFGFMALEAMAAGRPVVCFEGTALPAVTCAPECGVAVPMADSAALRTALDLLADHPEEAGRRGRVAQQIVRDRYNHEDYLDRIAGLYREVSSRGQEGVR